MGIVVQWEIELDVQIEDTRHLSLQQNDFQFLSGYTPGCMYDSSPKVKCGGQKMKCIHDILLLSLLNL